MPVPEITDKPGVALMMGQGMPLVQLSANSLPLPG